MFLIDPPEEWGIPKKWVARGFDHPEVSFLPWFIRAGGECHVESERRAMRHGTHESMRKEFVGKVRFFSFVIGIGQELPIGMRIIT